MWSRQVWTFMLRRRAFASSTVPSTRTGHPLRTMASLRNLAVGVHRQNGQTNIAAALRRAARVYRRPLTVLGLT